VVEGGLVSVAVVELRGDHDLDSKDKLWRPFARACSRAFLIADLSECTLIDSTALNLLLAAHRRQTKRGSDSSW
jgi:ABC-type transporter Mla MlaB component